MAVTEERVQQYLPNPAERSRQFVTSVYHRFDTALRNFLLNKLHDEAAAEDLAQEVYLRFSRLQDHSNIRSERAFLFATATNLLRDRSRRLTTKLDKASVCTDDIVLDCSTDDPARRVQHAQQLQILQDVLGTMSASCRSAFWMSRLDGKNYSEIAETMGVSVSMIEKHISAALARIRGALE